jgi:hypothetical protein
VAVDVSAGNGANLVVGLGPHTTVLGNGNNILIDGSATIVNPGDSFAQILRAWAAHPTAANQAAIRSGPTPRTSPVPSSPSPWRCTL